jgi:hypothetical protein
MPSAETADRATGYPTSRATEHAQVWVRTRTPHTPGHAVVAATAATGHLTARDLVKLRCTGTVTGGTVLTRQEAHTLLVMPCRCCFQLAVPQITREFGHD